MPAPDTSGRIEPPHGGDEGATLLGFLDYQRATLAWKCADLTDDQLRTPLPPSSPCRCAGSVST